jgi:hypothetical protein
MKPSTTKDRAPLQIFLLLFILTAALITGSLSFAAEQTARRPVAEILGKGLYEDDLVPARLAGEQKAKLAPDAYAAWYKREKGEKLKAMVWSAVCSDYAKKRNVEPTQAEIGSHVNALRKFKKEDRARQEKERAALIEELKTPGLSETRRKQAQQYLDTLNSLREFDGKEEKERSDPEREKQWQESERRVSAIWVKQWKVNQALFREFGGRIIFQQAGWEPIDAYRKLFEQYEANRSFVVHDRALREAVYGYFNFKFVYADEKKAAFYFEKPYWERTQEEMKAAGF